MFTKQELIRQRQSIDQLKHQNSLSPQSAEKLEYCEFLAAISAVFNSKGAFGSTFAQPQ